MTKNTQKITQESPYIILPTLVNQVGFSAAVFLQQIHYLLRAENKARIPYCLVTLQKIFPFWCDDTIRILVKKLQEKGFLILKEELDSTKTTRFLTINYDKFDNKSQSYLIQERPFILHPSLSARIGVKEEIVLQQIHFWTEIRLKKGLGPELKFLRKKLLKEFSFFCRRTVVRTLKSLEKQNLLHIQNVDDQTYYVIDYHEISKLVLKSISPAERTLDKFLRASPGTYGQQKPSSPQPEKLVVLDLKKDAFTPTFEEAVRLWKENVEQCPKLIYRTNWRANRLKHILSNAFNNEMSQWEDFCAKVSESAFLMGKTSKISWKVSFDWVLKGDHISRIQSNKYHNAKELENSQSELSKKQLLEEQRRSRMIQSRRDYVDKLPDNIWKRICQETIYLDEDLTFLSDLCFQGVHENDIICTMPDQKTWDLHRHQIILDRIATNLGYKRLMIESEAQWKKQQEDVKKNREALELFVGKLNKGLWKTICQKVLELESTCCFLEQVQFEKECNGVIYCTMSRQFYDFHTFPQKALSKAVQDLGYKGVVIEKFCSQVLLIA